MNITLAYGRTGLPVTLPDANVRHVLQLRPLPVVTDPSSATLEALRSPLGCPPLRELAAGKSNACIVTADITRPVPNPVILPPLLSELEAAGIPPERVTVLIGTGSHRPNTREELLGMLGEEAVSSGAQVVNHDAFSDEELVLQGETTRGTPVLVNRQYVDADLRISLALVEPHLIAGFSGGRKAICPGICGIETLYRFHAPPLVQPDEACSGLIEGNPAHDESLQAARLAPAPDLTVNATLDERRRITGVFAGELEAAHLAAIARSAAQCKVAIPEPVDIVVTSAAGYPLDLTFYQGVKGIASAVPILEPGGTIIIAHECSEGIGEPDLQARIMETEDLSDYQPRVGEPTHFHMDQWYAQFTQIMRRAGEILNVSSGFPRSEQAECFVTPVDSVEQAVEMALAKHGADASIAVMPEGCYVLACIEGDRIDRQRF